jgi:phosphohistidine phosphatase
MRRLILFRHAKAAPRKSGAGDPERALTPSGRADAAGSGRWLTQNGYQPDVVLVSPSVRTRETWECVADLWPASRMVLEESLYDALPEEIIAAIEPLAPGAETVMVVAHNPGLQEVAVKLLTEAAPLDADLIATGFPTATVAVLDMTDATGPRLENLFNPRHAPPPFVEAWDDTQGDAS